MLARSPSFLSHGVDVTTPDVVAPQPIKLREKVFGPGKTEIENVEGGTMTLEAAQDYIKEKRATKEPFFIEARSKIEPNAQFKPRAEKLDPQTEDIIKIRARQMWISPAGEWLYKTPQGFTDSHEGLAERYFKKQGIELPKVDDPSTIYGEMFARGFKRVVSSTNEGLGTVMYVDGKGPLTPAQRTALDTLGWEREQEVMYNNRPTSLGMPETNLAGQA